MHDVGVFRPLLHFSQQDRIASKAPASSYFCLPSTGVRSSHNKAWILMGVGDPSTGPYAHTTNTFPTEPSLQPLYQDSLPEHYQISLILKSHRDSDMNQFKKNSWPLFNFKMAYDTSNHSSNNTILECSDFVEAGRKTVHHKML